MARAPSGVCYRGYLLEKILFCMTDKGGASSFWQQYGTPLAVLAGAVIIAFAFAFGGGARDAGTGTGEPVAVDIKDVKTDTGPFIGDRNAPVTMAVWHDFQCPFCHQYTLNALSELNSTYVSEGKLRIVIKDFQFLGPASDTMAVYSRAVWEAHPDRWFEWLVALSGNQEGEGGGAKDLESIGAMTRDMGLDADRIAGLIESKRSEYEAAIAADRAEGQSFGINSTPTSIVGTTIVPGAQPAGAVRQLVDELL